MLTVFLYPFLLKHSVYIFRLSKLGVKIKYRRIADELDGQ